MEALIAIIGVATLFTALIIYGTFAWGYVAHVFYNWFLLTAFPNLPHLTLIQVIGLSFFVGLFTQRPEFGKKKEKDERTNIEKAKSFCAALGGPWFVLLLGYLFKTWFL